MHRYLTGISRSLGVFFCAALLVACGGAQWKFTHPEEKIVVPLGEWTVEPLLNCSETKRPVAVHRQPPLFPSTWGTATPWGRVVLAGIIATDGSVQELKVFAADDGRLAGPTLNALRQWRFEPATLKGKPVPVYFALSVNIDLQ